MGMLSQSQRMPHCPIIQAKQKLRLELLESARVELFWENAAIFPV